MPRFPVPAGETEASWFAKEVERGLGVRFAGGAQRQASRAGRLRGRGHHPDGLPRLLPRRRRLHRLGEGAGHPGRPGPRLGRRLDRRRTRSASPSSTRSHHGLIFERFLNPERVSMPDVDVDFDDRRRPEVIRYVTEKYGDDRVAQIVTYGTIKAKQALKDSARVLGMPFSVGERLTKAMPPPVLGKDMTLERRRRPDGRALQGGRRPPRARRHRRRGGEGLRDRARHREPQAAVGRARGGRDHVGRAAHRHRAAHEARGRRRDHHPVRPAAARSRSACSRWTSSGCAT